MHAADITAGNVSPYSLGAMKRIATGVLLLVASLFLLSRQLAGQHPAFAYVAAFCEAAMVGALADWFAVTALFRRPLGLPIPHTAIIPNNKSRLGASLGYFVQTNFLSEHVLSERFERIDLTGRACDWVLLGGNADRASRSAVSLLPSIINALNDHDVQRFLHQSVKESLQQIDLSSVVAKSATILLGEGQHYELLNELVHSLRHLLERHESFLRETLREEMPWYVPNFVHDKIYQSVVSGVRRKLAEIEADPNHPAREQIMDALQRFASELHTSPTFREQTAKFKDWMLSDPAVTRYIEHIWRSLKDIALRDSLSDQSLIRSQLQGLLQTTAQRLSENAAARETINRLLKEHAVRLVRYYRHNVVDLIADTVDKWDTETLIEKIELEVGKDLQYIRLNGTLVGGLVGLLLYVLG